jgi:hypothetical protein
MYAILSVTATSLLLIRMVVAGFLQRPGRFLSWPMFTRMSIVLPRLTLSEGTAVNIFSVRAPGAYTVGTGELQLMIDYLRDRGLEVTGGGVVMWAGGTSEFRVVTGRVVVDGD